MKTWRTTTASTRYTKMYFAGTSAVSRLSSERTTSRRKMFTETRPFIWQLCLVKKVSDGNFSHAPLMRDADKCRHFLRGTLCQLVAGQLAKHLTSLLFGL
uniref:Putative ankyrin repeat protein n=1 Tax=Ixodes ricinus TaxID=34613 RepID=A0A0K8RLT5_IXORI